MNALLRLLRRLGRDCRGGSAAEFVLVLPLLALLVFATIDAGWFAWQINRAEKATQAGARMAVVTDPVASGLSAEGYVGKVIGGVTLQQGDLIPAAALGVLKCEGASCTCATAPCPASLGFNATAFNAIVARMQVYDPNVTAANVVIEYRGSGLGFAGDPAGMEIAPLATVRLKDMEFNPISGFIWQAAVGLPDFAYSLTMEDGAGSKSN